MFSFLSFCWQGPGPRSLSWIILGPSPGVKHAKQTKHAKTLLFHKQQMRLSFSCEKQFFTCCMRTQFIALKRRGCHFPRSRGGRQSLVSVSRKNNEHGVRCVRCVRCIPWKQKRSLYCVAKRERTNAAFDAFVVFLGHRRRTWRPLYCVAR